MARMTRRTETVRTRDGTELRTYRWPTAGDPRAYLLLVHGIAEHAGRYEHVGPRLAAAGIDTRSYDLRGFGHSGGHRAYVDRWSRYLDDLEDRLVALRVETHGRPLVVYGHSMGALIALGYVLAEPARPLPDLLVLSAPATEAAIPAWQRAAAGALGRLLPRFAIGNSFPDGALTADAAVEVAYRADPIAVHRTTARLGAGLLREQERVQRVLARGGPMPVPTYVVHGADDPIVPERASRTLEGRANVTRRVYPGLHHETHNEPSWQAVVDDTIAWIIARV